MGRVVSETDLGTFDALHGLHAPSTRGGTVSMNRRRTMRRLPVFALGLMLATTACLEDTPTNLDPQFANARVSVIAVARMPGG